MLVLSASQEDRTIYRQRVENYLSGYFDTWGDDASLDTAWKYFDSKGDKKSEEIVYALDLENEVDDLAEAEVLFIDVYSRVEKQYA